MAERSKETTKGLLLPTLRVGTDICAISRIAEAHERFGDKFLSRILTEKEIAYVTSAPKHMITRTAARFAAKEAVVKVLGTGWTGVGWREVEVGRRAAGEPFIILHGRAKVRAEAMGLSHFELSMSHEREYALAFVVAY